MSNKKRTIGEEIIQTDEFLNILIRFGIPTASDDLLNADGISPFNLIFNTTLNKLRIYDKLNEIWKDATPMDLSIIYTKEEINSLFLDVNTELIRLAGLSLASNQLTNEIYIKDANGDIISTLNVSFLNNEGTSFTYNETTNSLDLLNEDNELLASIPVSAFLTNIANQITFNPTIPYELQLRDYTNNVLSALSINISNVKDLQDALNGKEPTIIVLPVTKGGTGISATNTNQFYIGGPGNTFIEKTPEQIMTLLGAETIITAGDGLQRIANTLKIVSASTARIVINSNNIDLAQTAVVAGTYTKVTVDNYGRVVSATNVTATDIGLILQSIIDLSANGSIHRISSTQVVVRTLQGTSGRVTVTNGDGVVGNPTIDLVPTTVVAGTYNGFTVDAYGRITSATQLSDKLPIATPFASGSVVSFLTDSKYGNLTTPITGNFTVDMTNAIVGVTNKLIHNDSVEPTYPANFKKLSGSGNYKINEINYIYICLEEITPTIEITYVISQRT